MIVEESKTMKPIKPYLQNQLPFSDNQTDNIPSFLSKTYDILENNKYQDIISWTKNGEGFIVKKVKQFSQTILPIYFRHNNYTSFVRQLNMYDFHKMRQQNQQNAFKNFLFKKGHKYLLKEIQRKDYKKNKETNKQLYRILEKQKIGEFNEGQSLNQIKQSPKIVKKDNQLYRTNIAQLKLVKNQLEEKSSKLLDVNENIFSNQMILTAIDALFNCQSAIKKAFFETELLKTDFQINQRKRDLSFLREPTRYFKKNQLQTFEKIETKQSMSGFKQPLIDAKVGLLPTSQPKQTAFSGFERFEIPQLGNIFLSK